MSSQLTQVIIRACSLGMKLNGVQDRESKGTGSGEPVREHGCATEKAGKGGRRRKRERRREIRIHRGATSPPPKSTHERVT